LELGLAKHRKLHALTAIQKITSVNPPSVGGFMRSAPDTRVTAGRKTSAGTAEK
jgi:hypothetical protein